jgi:hypothetical protein
MVTPQASAIKDCKVDGAEAAKRKKSKKHRQKQSISSTKENSGIRVRKVFIQNKSDKKDSLVASNMSKTAQTKAGFNLLTTSKEFKGRSNQQLAPIKQQSMRK